MFNLKKIKLKKLQLFLKKLPRILAENSFFSLMGLLFFSLLLGLLIFYQQHLLTEAPLEIIEVDKSLEFKEETGQKVKEEWQERNQQLSQIKTKEYPDPFQD